MYNDIKKNKHRFYFRNAHDRTENQFDEKSAEARYKTGIFFDLPCKVQDEQRKKMVKGAVAGIM
jgi:hypothetical protein